MLNSLLMHSAPVYCNLAGGDVMNHPNTNKIGEMNSNGMMIFRRAIYSIALPYNTMLMQCS